MVKDEKQEPPKVESGSLVISRAIQQASDKQR
jgi:hypothetical protein